MSPIKTAHDEALEEAISKLNKGMLAPARLVADHYYKEGWHAGVKRGCEITKGGYQMSVIMGFLVFGFVLWLIGFYMGLVS